MPFAKFYFRMSVITLCFLVLFSFISLCATATIAKPENKNDCELVTFGDSLTDNGVGPNDDQGIKRYSNGLVWPEFLGPLLDCKTIDDRGLSGARSGMHNVYFDGWSGAEWQVNTYLKSNKPSEQTIIGYQCAGLNDLRYHTIHKTLGPAVMQEIVINNGKNLGKLLAAGATKIIVMDIFEGAVHCPDVQKNKAMVPMFIQGVSAINAGIGKTIDQLRAKFPKATIAYFKTKNLWDEEIKNKFSELEKPFDYSYKNTKYGDWEKYVWYDDFHLLNDVHEILAKKFYEAYNVAKKD